MHIGILTGGISSEREIVLKSAANLQNWIDIAGYSYEIYDLPNEIDKFLQEYKRFDLIIPMLHGQYGEDGVITGMCESIGLKVAFSSSQTHALCSDKFRSGCVVEKLWVRVPKSWVPGMFLHGGFLFSDWSATTTDQVLELSNRMVVVKPNRGGSSLWVSLARNIEELKSGIREVDKLTSSLSEKYLWNDIGDPTFNRFFPSLRDNPIIQECIQGREFTVGVFRDAWGIQTLPIVEILNTSDIFWFAEKYQSDGWNEVFLLSEPELQNTLIDVSTRIYDFFSCRWVVRIDYRYNDTGVYFLEVNTIPGFTEASLIPKMWKYAGMTEKDFVDMLAWHGDIE